MYPKYGPGDSLFESGLKYAIEETEKNIELMYSVEDEFLRKKIQSTIPALEERLNKLKKEYEIMVNKRKESTVESINKEIEEVKDKMKRILDNHVGGTTMFGGGMMYAACNRRLAALEEKLELKLEEVENKSGGKL